MEEEQHKSMDQSEEKAGMDGENEGSFKRWREEIERMKEIREGGLIDQIQVIFPGPHGRYGLPSTDI